MRSIRRVGNQLPILLIDFPYTASCFVRGWESVTDPLDRLLLDISVREIELGISYRSS